MRSTFHVMLAINEIKQGKIIVISNEPYIVLKTDHHKMGRGGAVLKTKLKNLITGNALEKTFQGNDKAQEAETEKRKANYLYQEGGEAFFMDNENYEQFSLSIDQIGDKAKFLKEEITVDVLYFNDNPVSVNLPIKIDYKVTNAPPGVKGDSAGNVTKIVELETGIELIAPMFVDTDDIVRVNTDTGEYVERVN